MQLSRVLVGDLRGDDRAPVAALRPVTLVAELLHQLAPEQRRALLSEAARRRNLREAVARQRGRDDRERVGRVAAVRRRVGQQRQDLADLVERARPAVREDQRQRVGPDTLLVHEVDVVVLDAVGADRLRELRHAVQVGLLHAPVEAGPPVFAEFLHVGEVGAVLPAAVFDFGGPAGLREAALQVAQVGVGDLDLERLWHGSNLLESGVRCCVRLRVERQAWCAQYRTRAQ